MRKGFATSSPLQNGNKTIQSLLYTLFTIEETEYLMKTFSKKSEMI